MDRPYIFYELTNSICSTCHIKVEGKVITEGGSVFMLKRCPQHGAERVLISTDVEFYKQQRNFLKPGQLPLKFNTPFKHGCPYDCGLCPDHEQHSCISLIEITDQCNLTCPVCYANSSPQRTTHRSLEQIEFMLDRVIANEGEPDIVQISGGEAEQHPCPDASEQAIYEGLATLEPERNHGKECDGDTDRKSSPSRKELLRRTEVSAHRQVIAGGQNGSQTD